jgi:hypothetical protein
MMNAKTSNRTLNNPCTEGNAKILKAIVISPNEKTKDLGSILAIARTESSRREHTQENATVRAIVFVPELGVYVAIYESSNPSSRKQECETHGAS